MIVTDKREETLPFKTLIINRIQQWRESYDEDNRFCVAEAVTMVKRFRNDLFGQFDEEWLRTNHKLAMTYKPQSGKGFMTYPVIGRSIRSKIATEMNTPIKLTCEPVRKDPRTEIVAHKSGQIIAYFRRKIWTEIFDYNQSFMKQTGRAAFIHTSPCDTDGVDIRYPVTKEVPGVKGAYRLECPECNILFRAADFGMEDPQTLAQQEIENRYAEDVANDEDITPERYEEPLANTLASSSENVPMCPECANHGKEYPLQVKSSLAVGMNPIITEEVEKRNTGTIKSQLIPAMLIRADAYSAIGFDYRKCRWFNYHFLIPTYELRRMCEDDEQKQKVSSQSVDSWSSSARWHYELSKRNGNGSPYGRTYTYGLEEEMSEAELWWITPNGCADWESPEDLKIGNWQIKQGQTIEESFGGEEDFKGLGVLVSNDEVLKVFNEDFKKRWTGIAWTPDPFAFLPQGEERLLHLQDVATRTFTLIYAFSQRASMPRTIANPYFFSKEQLTAHVVGGIVLSKHTSKDLKDVDLRRHLFNLDSGELPAATQLLVDLIIQLAKEESGIYDETVGAGNSDNQTATGRKVALDRSLGLQLPQIKAKGNALIDWAYLILEIAAEMENDEFFLLFSDESEEEWTYEEIEMFKDCNFRTELNISVTDGSDIPRTREELEEAYTICMQQGLFDPNNPAPVDIRQTILNIRGIDYDLQDVESNTQIAEKRFDAMKKYISTIDVGTAITATPIIDTLTGKPSLSPNAEPIMEPALNPAILQNLMMNTETKPYELVDNHFIMIGYYKRKLYGVLKQKKPSAPLVLAINAMIQAHRGYIAAEIARQQNIASVSANGTGNPPSDQGGNQPN